MESLTFVLGALSGLFLLGMVFAIVGVVKTRKKTQDLQEQINSIHRTIDDVFRRIDEALDHALKVADENRKDGVDRVDTLSREANHRADEIVRYIDSRIDKSQQSLITRMDLKIRGTVLDPNGNPVPDMDEKPINPEEGD